ncbi:hypothetical protein C8Q76DRAFT_123184 [Earliella scabrosa]|nr:hypothetical protein C8Q76DRAFT_123184 [Earliella scabrosa]
MGDICLSVAPILRCQSLSRLEAGILLLPPGVEIIFASVLLWVKRGSDKKHVFLAAEVIVYFILAVLDVLTHTIPNIGTSIDTFKSLDILIGVASVIPLFLYTFALYLLTATELVPSLPLRFQNITKYVLLAFIPLILILNEAGSFVGITYRSFLMFDNQTVLGVGFSNATAQMFLGSVTLVLHTAFQACNFCIAFYRLMKALSHQRTIDSTQAEKEMEAHLFRGLGWIVAGLKLGAIETVIGFAHGGFGVAFTRRLLRLLGHGCLIIGIVKGVDTIEDFQLYSPGEAQKRRKSMLRAMIQNPRFSTFRHVGGHDFEKQNPFDEKRNSVIKLGDPSWMRRDFAKPAPIDEERATPGLLAVRKPTNLAFQLASKPSLSRKSVRDSTSSFGSTNRNSWPSAQSSVDGSYDLLDVQSDAEEVDVSGAGPRPRLPRAPNQARQRVTVHIRKDRLPVLQLRRLSNLEFLDLVEDPFRDPHVRARSLPNVFEQGGQPRTLANSTSYPDLATHARGRAPAFPIRRPSKRESVGGPNNAPEGAEPQPWNGVVPVRSARDSAVSFGKRVSVGSAKHLRRASTASSISSYHEHDDGGETPRPTSFHAIGSPDETITSWVSPGSRVPSHVSRRERGLSSSTTASEVHALALQFPGIPAPVPPPPPPPMRPFSAAPARRSMLSHEVPRTEFVVESEPPMPQPQSEREVAVARTPSVRRKPAPLITAGLVDERISGVEIEQVVDDAYALPTPESAPRYPRKSGVSVARSHLHVHAGPADVPRTALEDEDDDFAEDGEVGVAVGAEADADVDMDVGVVRSASVGRRGQAQQAKLMRVKSVGSAPMRSVSAARRTAFARESVKVELGHIAREGRLPADVAAGEAF